MCGVLRLVQRGGDWAGQQPTQASPRCTKRNSPSINGQCTTHRIDVLWSVGTVTLRFQCGYKWLKLLITFMTNCDLSTFLVKMLTFSRHFQVLLDTFL